MSHNATIPDTIPKSEVANIYKVKSPKFPLRGKLRTAMIVVLTIIIGATLLTSAAGTAYLYTQDRILPHISVAGLQIGGLDRLAATEILQNRFETMIDSGLDVKLGDNVQHLELHTNVATDPDLVYQLVDWDINTSVNAALAIGRNDSQVTDFFAPIYHLLFKRVQLEPDYTFAEARLNHALRAAFPNTESDGTPTDFVFIGSGESLGISVVEAVPGAMLDLKAGLARLKQDALDLSLDTLELELVERTATISQTLAETLIPQALVAIEQAPYTLNFNPEYGKDLNYLVTANDLKIWLLPGLTEDHIPSLILDTNAMQTFLDSLHADIDIAPQDAKFVIDEGRVIDFAESRDGFVINEDKIIDDLLTALGTGNTTISIAAARTLPAVPTASANDLGIKEVLGVGFSSFAGSPANRRVNIKHGAEKLNGILIPPGETLSLLEKLRPFTVADGYLAELVIKGDEIIPEIGGGLCQIGTTTFRAALNSGLDIAERRNHSLVVSYYNDPANNNPGTDATIYDPAPDLKIVNDTGHHIMLITEVNAATSELFFTFWGTSDGRKASYTPPVVLSWTGYGTTVEKETTSLALGVRQCQSPHPGATTTFNYNIIMPDGSLKTREFFSSYRSLPTICLVGIGEEGGGELSE